MAKNKAYAVWAGHQRGVFDTWAACQSATHGFSSPRFQGFRTRREAEAAFAAGDPEGGPAAPRTAAPHAANDPRSAAPDGRPGGPGICVDGACRGNPGPLEYRGVDLRSGEVLFAEGPMPRGTNNLGEFLALVGALRLVEGRPDPPPVYTDSGTARAWLRKRAHNCGILRDGTAGDEVTRRTREALAWLRDQPADAPFDVRVWRTDRWGEIPADYGRKG